MLVYKDIFNNAVLFNDTFPIKEVGEVYEIEAKKEQFVVHNPSAGTEHEVEAIDMVVNNLRSIQLDAEGIEIYLSKHAQNLMSNMIAAAKRDGKYDEAEAQAFYKDIKAACDMITSNFDKYRLFVGIVGSGDKNDVFKATDDATIMFLREREDGSLFFTVFKRAVYTETYPRKEF
ncbi:hypothetical protein BGZ81_010309 [Podila clonocystis]|nr:hypothetical protein BGZ81_010309 [Podila clonocystis]